MEVVNGDGSSLDDVNATGSAELYLRKYLALQRRCEQVQQNNERLVNRLQHVKKIIRRFKKERKFLTDKLDEYNDNYLETAVPYPWEDGSGSINEHFEMQLAATMCTEQESDISFEPSSSKSKKIKIENTTDSIPSTSTPKKPANAFLMFCSHQRPIMQEENRMETGEEISHQDLTRQLALLWNGLPRDKKQVYYDLYERDKVRFETEVAAQAISVDSSPPGSSTIIDVVGTEFERDKARYDSTLLAGLIKIEPL